MIVSEPLGRAMAPLPPPPWILQRSADTGTESGGGYGPPELAEQDAGGEGRPRRKVSEVSVTLGWLKAAWSTLARRAEPTATLLARRGVGGDLVVAAVAVAAERPPG